MSAARRRMVLRSRGTAGGNPSPLGGRPGNDPFLYRRKTRWIVTTGVVTAGLAIVVGAALVRPDPDRYVAVLGLVAGPYSTPGAVLAYGLLTRGPAEHRAYWRSWLGAALTAHAAGVAALAGALAGIDVLVAVGAVLLVAAAPQWCATAVRMLPSEIGSRATSVEVCGALMTTIVFVSIGVVAFGDELVAVRDTWLAAGFVASLCLAPAGVHLSVRRAFLVSRDRRLSYRLRTALCVSLAVNGCAQLAHVLSGFALPLGGLTMTHVVNVGLVISVPLWAQHGRAWEQGQLPPEQQVRRVDALAAVTFPVLALLSAFAWLTADEAPWRVHVVVLSMLGALAVFSVRQAALLVETKRLYGDMERVARSRRRLIVALVSAIDQDRRRLAAELHSQTVELFAAICTFSHLAQTRLPSGLAPTVKRSLAQLQDDLRTRAEELRRLTLAVDEGPLSGHTSPGCRPERTSGGTLIAEVAALASGILGDRSSVEVSIDIDADLSLDWRSEVIAYHIVKEALLNAADHARASRVRVELREDEGWVAFSVADDGCGFDAARVPRGGGMARMDLLADLGNGTLSVEGAVGCGTVVRGAIDGRSGRPRRAARRPPSEPRGTHLRLVVVTDRGRGSAGGSSAPV